MYIEGIYTPLNNYYNEVGGSPKEVGKGYRREEIDMIFQSKLFQTWPLIFLGWDMISAEVGRDISTDNLQFSGRGGDKE